MADEVVGGDHDDLAPGLRQGKGPYQSLLSVFQLRDGHLWYEGHAFAILHDSHKCLDASQSIGFLADGSRFQMTELYELVAEAVSLVEQPQKLLSEI